MRRVTLGTPPRGNPDAWQAWIERSLREIERASGEEQPREIVRDFAVENLTEERGLDVATASATDVAKVLGTLIAYLRRGGAKRG